MCNVKPRRNKVREVSTKNLLKGAKLLNVRLHMCNIITFLELTLERLFCCNEGRNENAQLGQGDTVRRDVPTLIDSLTGLNIVRVACGKAHTLFLTGTLWTYLLVFLFRICCLQLVAVTRLL